MDTGYRYKSRSAHAQHSAQDGGYRRHQIVRSRDRQRSLWLAVEASCPTSVCGKEVSGGVCLHGRTLLYLWSKASLEVLKQDEEEIR